MAFKKGMTKTGGRAPGSKNVIARELRGRVQDIVNNNMEALEETIQALEPKERIVVLLKLMEFILPKGVPAPPLPDQVRLDNLSLEEKIQLRELLRKGAAGSSSPGSGTFRQSEPGGKNPA